MNPVRRRSRRPLLVFVGAGLAAGFIAVAAFRAWSNRSTIDGRALALLQASDARINAITAVTGKTILEGNGDRRVSTFRLLRPFYADVRMADFNRARTASTEKPATDFFEIHWSGKTAWRVRKLRTNGQRYYTPLSTSSLQSRFDQFGDNTLLGALFAKTLFNNAPQYDWLTKPRRPGQLISVRYASKRVWRGVVYDEVQIREITHDAPPAWDDVRRGSYTFGEWARGRIGLAALGGDYEAVLLIGADHLVHKKTYTLTSYYHGEPHWGTGKITIELQTLRINPPLTPADFRYAPPVASAKGAAKP